MTDQQADHLNRVENQRGHLDMARQSLEFFVQKDDIESVNATLTVHGGVLEIQYLGRRLVAPPRLVIVEGDLALEYTFVEQNDGLPVWQFYLMESERGKYELRRSPGSDAGSRICDHTNTNAPTRIVTEVCMALLASPAMLARPSRR